jgi:transposase-like protein
MTKARAFRGFRFPAEVIWWAVRWYLQFPLSYRELERMLADRGVEVDHTTMHRWVQRFAPELEKRLRRHLRPCRGPWHVDETYVRVGGQWRYLYRAVDGTGQTIDFRLSAKRDKQAAKRFLRQALGRDNTRNPREIVTDRLKSYPGALREMSGMASCGASSGIAEAVGSITWSSRITAPHQAPDPAHAGLWGLLDGKAHPGQCREHGDAGQGLGACRAGERHAGAAGVCTPGLRSCGLSEGEPARARPQSANATDPLGERTLDALPAAWPRSTCPLCASARWGTGAGVGA